MIKEYCPDCSRNTEMTIQRCKEDYPVKGDIITIDANVCVCSNCGNKVFSVKYDDENLKRAYTIYRERHNLLSPEEIRNIRESYSLSQVSFARLLGVGDKTVARYEGGSLQDEAINNLILLASIPSNMAVLVEKNKTKIPAADIDRLKKIISPFSFLVVWKQSPYVFSTDSMEACSDDQVIEC